MNIRHGVACLAFHAGIVFAAPQLLAAPLATEIKPCAVPADDVVPDRPPPAPVLDRVEYLSPESIRDRRVILHWLVPAFNGDEAVDCLVIEQRAVKLMQWQVVREEEYTIRDFRYPEQTATRTIAPPTFEDEYDFRVCFKNRRGRSCSSQRRRLTVVNPRFEEAEPALQVDVAAETLTPLTIQQSAPGVDRLAGLGPNELLCRGGGIGYPGGRWGQVPGKPDREWHMVFILYSEAPARSDGSGLEPGRCAFPGGGGSENIGHVVLETAPGDGTAQQIATRMVGASAYWRFLLRRNTEMDWYEVLEHDAWTPPPSAGAVRAAAAGGGVAVPIQGTAPMPAALAALRSGEGGIPPNLFTLDDAATLVVAGESTPAAEVKRTVRADLERLPEPTRTFALCAVGADRCNP